MVLVTEAALGSHAHAVADDEHADHHTGSTRADPFGCQTASAIDGGHRGRDVDQFDADFFSIGSNDLTQYVTAAGRDIGAVADLATPLNPAVMRLIASVARHGRESGRGVSLCGDAGGDLG